MPIFLQAQHHHGNQDCSNDTHTHTRQPVRSIAADQDTCGPRGQLWQRQTQLQSSLTKNFPACMSDCTD
jgi:hypothetical protein